MDERDGGSTVLASKSQPLTGPLDPRLNVRAQALALDGTDDQRIATICAMSLKAVANALAQVLTNEEKQAVMGASWFPSLKTQLPDNMCYRDVQQARLALRARQASTQVDSTLALRQKLIVKAANLLENGHVGTWKDVMMGLRIVGVPQAPNPVNTAGHGASSAPLKADTPEYIYDETGSFVRNPEYLTAAERAMGAGSGGSVININIADLRREYAQTNSQAAAEVILNPANQIVGVQVGVERKDLTNMDVAELRELANPTRKVEAVVSDTEHRTSSTVDLATEAELEELFKAAL